MPDESTQMWKNTNAFLDSTSDYYNGNVKGVKTGSLSDDYNLVVLYQQHGKEFLICSLGSKSNSSRYDDVNYIINDTGNKHSPTVIVAAITGQIGTKKKLPTHTIVHNVNGLDKDSIILLEQIRTIDKQRLQEYLGTLDGRFLVAVDKALAISVALERGGKSA